eukprot:scaffold1236_cov138-Skeletonema_marinoi.AAC.14
MDERVTTPTLAKGVFAAPSYYHSRPARSCPFSLPKTNKHAVSTSASTEIIISKSAAAFALFLALTYDACRADSTNVCRLLLALPAGLPHPTSTLLNYLSGISSNIILPTVIYTQNSLTLLPIIMTVNANDSNAPKVEIIAIELPLGHDAEDEEEEGDRSNKRNKILLIAAILFLCGTGVSAAAVSSNNIARSFFMTTTKSSKASKPPNSTKTSKAGEVSSVPSLSLEPSPSPSFSLEPSPLPSLMPSPSPSQVPSFSLKPSPLPSLMPSPSPSQVPSFSLKPSPLPSLMPSPSPSLSLEPSSSPSLSLEPSVSGMPSLDSCVPESPTADAACDESTTGEISAQSCRGLNACQGTTGESE